MRSRLATIGTAASGALLLGACSFPLSAGRTPVTEPSAHAPRTIVVTEADSGSRYRLHLGDHLIVRLAGPSIYTWTEPESSKSAVLRRTVGASGSTATAAFAARATGRAKVTATDNPNCYPQCLPPSFLFYIGVTVVR
jgi:hypothetical protein